MFNGAFISACAHGSISKGRKFVVVWLEVTPCLGGTLVKDNDHEAPHQEGSVRLLRVVQGSVVVYFVVAVLLITNQLFELLTEQMHFTKIQRSKISEEGLVDKIVVDTEVKGVSS